MTINEKGMPRLLTKTKDGDPLKLVAGAVQLVGYLPFGNLPKAGADGSWQATVWSEPLDYDDVPLYTTVPLTNLVDDEEARQIASLMVENDVLREGMRKTELEIRDWISKPELDRESLLGRLSLLLLQMDEILKDHSKAHLLVGLVAPDQSSVVG